MNQTARQSQIWLLLWSAVAVAASSDPVQITSTPANDPSVSSAGDYLVVDIPSGGGIGVVPADGGSIDPITTIGREPSWRPASTLIVFREGSTLYTVDAFDGVPPEFLADVGFDDNPEWSPLGNEIAVQGNGSYLVLIGYPSGSNTLPPCTDPDQTECEFEFPTWSPDGSELAFEDGSEILRVARSGGSAQLVISEPGDLSEPSWSPDGKWIAFAKPAGSFPDEESHIWVVDARGPSFGIQQQTFGAYQDRSPTWSPDSSQLYFESNRSGETCIWRVAFDAPVAASSATWGALKSRLGSPN